MACTHVAGAVAAVTLGGAPRVLLCWRPLPRPLTYLLHAGAVHAVHLSVTSASTVLDAALLPGSAFLSANCVGIRDVPVVWLGLTHQQLWTSTHQRRVCLGHLGVGREVPVLSCS